MKRDMNLIRKLLLRTETGEGAEGLERDYSPEVRAYHIALLKEAGLLDAVVGTDSAGTPTRAATTRLTWEGHEFLDAMRDETIWKKAQEKVLKPAGSWTFRILLEYLKMEAKKQIGLP